VFGVGMFGPEGDAIKASAQDKGVFRGAVAFGGTDLPGKTAALVKKMLAGEQYPAITWDELACATAGANGDLVIKPMINQGFITVTP
jgi:hypothetical protein